MANSHRGEVSFECEGQNYILSFTTNALCELEDALNLGIAEISEILSDPKRLRMKYVRAVIWAGLTDKHPQITIKEAGLIVGVIGLQKAIDLMSRGFSLAFPDGGEGQKNPPKGRAGTGRAS